MAVQVVSFHCVLKNKLGQVISSTFNRNVLTASRKNSKTLSALADALQNLRKGEKRRILLTADQAYGFYNPELVLVRPLEELDMSEPLQVGERVVYVRDGKKQSFWVTEITRDSVTLDANHPLAGQDLVFEIEATEAREATYEELEMDDQPAPLTPAEPQTNSYLH